MNRFSQLEFGEESPEPKCSRGEAVRDADYFQKEAMRFWLAGDFEMVLRNYSRVLEAKQHGFRCMGRTGADVD